MDWLTTSLSDRWMLVLLHFLWQGCLVAALVGGVLKLVRPRAPGSRYALLLAALGLLVVLPLATFAVIEPPARRLAAMIQPTPQDELADSAPFPASPDSPIAEVVIPTPALEAGGTFESRLSLDQLASALPDFIAEPAPVVPPHVTVAIEQPQADNESVTPPTDWLHRAQPIVLLGWLVGCLLCGLRLGIAFIRTLLLRRGCQTPDPLLWQRTLAIAEVIGLRRVPRLLLSPRVQDAVVVGYLRPLVLLPLAWATELPTDVLDAVIAHELAHIRRFDLWVILLQRVTETVFFYHPAVWWLSRRLSRERELCCDELAASAVGSGRRYAVALEHVAHWLRGLEAPRRLEYSLTPTLGGRKMELLHRVQHALRLDHGMADRRTSSGSQTARLPHGLALAIVPIVLAAAAWVCLAPQPSQAEPAPVANPENQASEESTSTAIDDDVQPQSSAAEKVRPSVVAIRTQKPMVAGSGPDQASPFVNPVPADPADAPQMIAGCATGIIIDPAGFVLAPHHVVDGVAKCEVILANGRVHPAKSIARKDDFAVLKFQPEAEVPALPLDWLRPVDDGDELQWIGNGWGRSLRTASGTVSSTGQSITINETLRYENLLGLSGDVAPGDSGAPLFDAQGRCRGIFVAIRAGTSRTGYACPMDQVEPIAAQLLQSAKHIVGVREPAEDAGEYHPVVTIRAETQPLRDSPQADPTASTFCGCGVIVDPRGYIATVLPQAVRAESIRVRLSDGTQASAVVAAAAPVLSDLPASPVQAAILKVEAPAPLLFLPILDNVNFTGLRGTRAVIRQEGASLATVTGRCVPYVRADRLDGQITQRTKLGLYGEFHPTDLGAPVLDAEGRLRGLVESFREGLNGRAEVYESQSLRQLFGAVQAAAADSPDDANEPIGTTNESAAPPADQASKAQAPQSPYWLEDDVQFFAAGPEKLPTAAKTDEAAAIDAALEAWCRGSEAPSHFKFTRYIYDSTFYVEWRAVGEVWRASPTRWRLDLEPSDKLPEPDWYGVRMNPRKAGPNGQPFEVKADTASRWIRDGQTFSIVDCVNTTYDQIDLPNDVDSRSTDAIEESQSQSMHGQSIGGGLRSLCLFFAGAAYHELHPALVSTGHNPQLIRDRYSIALGPMTKEPGRGPVAHLVLTPRFQDESKQITKLELLLEMPSGRCQAMKQIDPSGQKESVYVFDQPDPDDKPALGAKVARAFKPDAWAGPGYKRGSHQHVDQGEFSRQAQETHETSPVAWADTELSNNETATVKGGQTDETVTIEAALKAWCRPEHGLANFEFERFCYDSETLTEWRARGEVWRVNNKNWRISVDPVALADLPESRVNSKKLGPDADPYRVEPDAAARFLRLESELYLQPGIELRQFYSPRSAARSLPSWPEVAGSMAAFRKRVVDAPEWALLSFGLYSDTMLNPAFIDVGPDAERLKAMFNIRLGEQTDMHKPHQVRLLLTPKPESGLASAFATAELLIDLESRRCIGLKFRDIAGRYETVYRIGRSKLIVGNQAWAHLQRHFALGKDGELGQPVMMTLPTYTPRQYYPVSARSVPVSAGPKLSLLGAAAAVLEREAPEPTVRIDARSTVWVLTGQVTTQAEADRLLELVRGQRRPVKVREVVSELKVVADGDEDEAIEPQQEAVPADKAAPSAQLPTGLGDFPSPAREIAQRIDDDPHAKANRAIATALEQPITVRLVDTSFEAGIQQLAGDELLDALVIDTKALVAAGVDVKSPVSCEVESIRRRSALRLVLQPRGVDFRIADGRLELFARREWINASPDDKSEDAAAANALWIEEAIHTPLARKVDVEFIDTPLGEALGSISRNYLHDRLTIDEPALQDAGVSLKVPVSLVVSGITVQSALKLLLENKDLGWIVDDGKLVVTSRWVVEGKPITKVYAVADLVTPAATDGATSNDEAAAHAKLGDQLVALLTATVQPDAWDVNGGRGGVQFVAGNLALVVRCPQRVHDDVAKWIDRLRTLPGGARRPSILADRTEPEAADGTREEVLDQSAQERFRRRLTEFQQAAVTEEALRIERALEQLTTVDVDATPLMKVLEAINREQRINIVVDESGLLESGVTAKTPLTLHLHDVPLKAVLQCLLEPLNLDYVVEDEVLKITGSMRANGFAAESYDLSALLAKEDDPAVQLNRYAELLRQSIAPDSWDQAGGPGHVSPHVPLRKLIVRQSASAHRDIAHLLANLQRLQAGEASVNPPFSTDAAAEQQAAARLLTRRGAVNLQATPLRDLPAALGPLADGKIWLDARGPLEAGRALDMPVSFAAPDISLGEALTQILQPLELDYRVRDGLVVISSPERCGGPATVRVHALPAAWLESLTAGKVTSAALTTQVQNAIDRRYWEARGGLGTITLEGRTQSLVIYQTERRHQEIERFLTQQAGK